MKVQVKLPQTSRWKDLCVGESGIMQRSPKCVYVKLNTFGVPDESTAVGFSSSHRAHGNALVFENGVELPRVEWVEEGAKVSKAELEIWAKAKP